MILLDTTVLVDVVRGVPAARAWVTDQDTVAAASEITRAEILRGMRSHERSATHRALDDLRWLPVDEEVATRAGALGRQYRASHHLGLPDLLIAATALVNGVELVTSNVKHFPMFSGLTAPY